MRTEDLLLEIQSIAAENGIDTPYLVGGVPRDRVLDKTLDIVDIKDIDITTGTESANKLSEILGKKWPNSNYRTYDDGHSSLYVNGVHIDFSSNFIAPGVEDEMVRLGVQEITTVKKEIYSRDFTINTLLETLDFNNIYDITGEAANDLAAGLIKCPINPKITIGVDPRRILRAIKFSVKYGFEIESNLRAAMLENKDNIQNLPKKFVQNKMNEIVMLDDDKGIEMLVEFKLLPLVPLTKTISDMLVQKRMLSRAL